MVVRGVEEKHTEGRYFLNFNNRWIDVGEDALGAQRKGLLRLNQIEYERLSGTSLPASPVGRPTVVEFSGRKVIKDEVEAYLADLELTRRPARTVQSKRKYLGDFLGLIGKKFADEYRREDVLKYSSRNRTDIGDVSRSSGRTVPIQPYALAASGNIAAAPRTAGLDDRESA